MAPLDPEIWKTDREYIELLNYLIERTKDAKSPMNIAKLAREYKGSASSVWEACIRKRIKTVRYLIPYFDHIDLHTKLKLIFALSAPVKEDFLEKIMEGGLVKVDEKNRITYYKSINREIEFRGVHGQPAENDFDLWTSDPEYVKLLNYLIEKTKNAKSSMNIGQLAREYNERNGARPDLDATACVRNRIEKVRHIIHSFDHIDTDTKVKVIFGLSAPVAADFLEKLKKDAKIEIDEKDRIIYYKGSNGKTEFRGGHGQAAAHDPELWTTDSEYVELLNYLIERTKDAKSSPLVIGQLAREYKGKMRARGLEKTKCVRNRISSGRHLIHSFEHIDTDTKVKMIFGLSAPVRKDFLEKLREDALVEVDEWKRIVHYKANNGRLELGGAPCQFPGLTPNRNIDSKTAPTSNSSANKRGEKRKADTLTSNTSKRTKTEAPRDVQIIPKPKDLEEKGPLQTENPIEKVNSERAQNPKIKFFEIIKSLIICLNIPSSSWILSNIRRNIQEIEKSNEVSQPDEVVSLLELLITRITNHSVSNLSKNVESVSLSTFLCYLRAAILNSKICGVEDLVEDIRMHIEESQNERIPMEKMMSALRATLDVDGFY